MAAVNQITGKDLHTNVKAVSAKVAETLKELEDSVQSSDSSSDIATAIHEAASDNKTIVTSSTAENISQSLNSSYNDAMKEAIKGGPNAVGAVVDVVANSFSQLQTVSERLTAPLKSAISPITDLTEKFGVRLPIFSSFDSGFGFMYSMSPETIQQMREKNPDALDALWDVSLGVDPAEKLRSETTKKIMRKAAEPVFGRMGTLYDQYKKSITKSMTNIITILKKSITSKELIILVALLILIIGIMMAYKKLLRKPEQGVNVSKIVGDAVQSTTESMLEVSLNEGIFSKIKNVGLEFVKKLILRVIRGLRSVAESMQDALEKPSLQTVSTALVGPVLLLSLIIISAVFPILLVKSFGGKKK